MSKTQNYVAFSKKNLGHGVQKINNICLVFKKAIKKGVRRFQISKRQRLRIIFETPRKSENGVSKNFIFKNMRTQKKFAFPKKISYKNHNFLGAKNFSTPFWIVENAKFFFPANKKIYCLREKLKITKYFGKREMYGGKAIPRKLTLKAVTCAMPYQQIKQQTVSQRITQEKVVVRRLLHATTETRET